MNRIFCYNTDFTIDSRGVARGGGAGSPRGTGTPLGEK